jgi:hypothetical protein
MNERYEKKWSRLYASEAEAGVTEHKLLKIEPGVRPPFEKFGKFSLQSWLIERGVPFEHNDEQPRLAELADEYWQEF